MVWIVLVAFAITVGIAYGAALGPTAGALMGCGLAVLLVVGVWFTSPVIVVRDGLITAGPASISTSLVATVHTLDADAMRQARDGRHPQADARSYTVVRPWSGSTGVLITLDDPLDPHPSWVITSRAPEALRTALNRAGCS